MHEALRKYINQHTSEEISDDDFAIVQQKFLPRHYRKKQYLLQEGDVSKYVAFIVKGAVRRYIVDEKGIEHISNLCIENWWVGDRESFNNLTPSIYNIDAVEDTDALLLTKANYEELISNIPIIVTVFRTLDYTNQIAAQKRLNAAISYSAEKRYMDLVNTYPSFLQRFPQNMIASYLGISPETLSRIRKKAKYEGNTKY